MHGVPSSHRWAALINNVRTVHTPRLWAQAEDRTDIYPHSRITNRHSSPHDQQRSDSTWKEDYSAQKCLS